MPETRSWQVRWQSAQRSAHGAWQSAHSTWQSTSKERRQTWQLAAGSAVVGLAVAAGAVAASGPWDSGQRTAERAAAAAQDRTGGENHGGGPAPAPSAAAVLPPLGAPSDGGDDRGAAPPPSGTGLADTLSPLMKDPALGPVRTASVVDVATGREIFAAKAGEAATPASTVKLATALAALAALGPDHRIDTTVVEGAEKGHIVLVGGGDPTLTARAPKNPGQAAQDRPASLRALADETARALKKRGTTKVTLDFDVSAYSGPVRHPISPNENVALVTPLMADEARLDDSDHGPADRDPDPSGAAARTFAGLLRDRGITVDNEPSATKAPARATRLATTRSLPLSALVERMLTHSDNDIAEALARQTARAAGEPVSFEGAQKAVRDRLAALQLPVSGAVFEDGSGLDRDDRTSAALLSRVLVLAASPEHPEFRSVMTGLPVAGFSGTLSSRYADQSDLAQGAGTVRAKTGTLTGVNTLAGTVVDADGRLLAFAFMTTGTTDPQNAQRALDRLASAVANCGCR